MVDKLEFLQSSQLFAGLPPDQLKEVAAIGVTKSYGRGETIFFEGDQAVGFYMVTVGRVKIYKVSPNGKEHILHIFDGGEPFGEVPVFSGKPYPASAQTLVATKTLFFPRNSFVRLLEDNSSIALNMLAVLSLRLRRFAQQIENLSLKEVPARLAGYLLYLSEEQGGKDEVELDIAKGQLASLLGTIPETLSRIFAKMGDEGLIRVAGRKITLVDRERLMDC